MTGGIGSCLDTLDVHGEVAQRYVAHLHCESGGPCEARLGERSVASKRGFDCETLTPRNSVLNERLELAIYDLADVIRDADIRALVQFRGPIVSVE
jgi:hypothetical protein